MMDPDSEPPSPPVVRMVVTCGSSRGVPPCATASSPSPCRSTFERPQSTTCTSPKAPTMMFDGLRSRWMTPRAWA